MSLFTESVHALGAGQYDAAQLAAWAPRPPDREAWRERLARLRTLVAEERGRLAGFVSCGTNGHVEFLYVAPGLARRGVASALLREIEAELAALGVAELCTEASEVARPFFERHGFTVTEAQDVRRGDVVLRRYAMRRAPGRV